MARFSLIDCGFWVRAGLLLLLGASPASAQTRLYLLFAGDTPLCLPSNCEPPRVVEIDVDGRRIGADTPVLHARENGTPPVVTPDGRYLAWSGTENRMTAPSYLNAFDTATRAQIPLVRTSATGLAGYLLADPLALRLYAQFETGAPISELQSCGAGGLPVLRVPVSR